MCVLVVVASFSIGTSLSLSLRTTIVVLCVIDKCRWHDSYCIRCTVCLYMCMSIPTLHVVGYLACRGVVYTPIARVLIQSTPPLEPDTRNTPATWSHGQPNSHCYLK